jgi:lipoyl(octanoyl) transferase
MRGLVTDLGRRDYAEVWEVQKKLVQQRFSDEIFDTLILVEHPHVVTLGRKTSKENFSNQSIPVYQVERGGDATYHGPGQLVGYPIVKLVDHDVRKYVRMLEEVIIRVCRRCGIEASRIQGNTGVWASGKKLASIGVAVSNWVTFHGFAINVTTDLSYFRMIKPCGLDPSIMTSMASLTGKEFDIEEIKGKTVSEFANVFGITLTPKEVLDVRV